jgi:predicted double-glycine peptidase
MSCAPIGDHTYSRVIRRPIRSLLEFRQDKVVIQKWDISCGAAALATILTYQHGDPVPEKRIAEAMLKRTDPLRVKHRGGFSLLDLKTFAESRGYEADGYTEVDLENLVDFGPSIVPVSISDYNHFVVFRGIVGDRVFLADPGFGNRTVSIEEFQDAWVQNMAFVVTRTDGNTARSRLAPRNTDVVTPTASSIRAAIRPGG